MSDKPQASPFIWVPRSIGDAIAIMPAGVATSSGRPGQDLHPGWMEPRCWEWDTVRRILAVQLMCGDRLRSTRVTNGDLSPTERAIALEVAGDLFQLFRVLPRYAAADDPTGSQTTALPRLDPSGLLVLGGMGVVLTPEGLGRLDGVFSSSSRPRSDLDPDAQAARVDAAVWSRAHVASWRRGEITVNGKRVPVLVPAGEELHGVSCPVRFIEDPDVGTEPPPTISFPPASISGDRARARNLVRIISWVSPVDSVHKQVVGGLAKVVEPEAYPTTPGVGAGVEWAAVADVDLDDFLGKSGPPDPPPEPEPDPKKKKKITGVPPTPPNPPPPGWYPPPFGDDNIEEELLPPLPPPVIDPTGDTVAVGEQIELEDSVDEQIQGPQDRQAFADPTGTATAVRSGIGTSEPREDVFVTTQTPLGPVVQVDPGAALEDEALRTPKTSVPCPLTEASSLGLTLAPSVELPAVDDQTLNVTGQVTYPDGTSDPIRVPTGGIGTATAEERQALVDAATPFAPVAMPGAIGSALSVWGTIRTIIATINALIAIVGSAFVGGRWSFYKGNLAVISDQSAQNIIGVHVTNPDTEAAPVQPGLTTYQGVTSTNRTATVDRPAATTTRALEGDVTATAPVVRIDKRLGNGAVDETPYIDAGRGKFVVLTDGTASVPGVELRSLTAADAAALAAERDELLVYQDSVTGHVMRVSPAGEVVDLETGAGTDVGSGGSVGYPSGESQDGELAESTLYFTLNDFSWGGF